VLIAVSTAGLNYVEVNIRSGEYPVTGISALKPPFIPGSEVAGTIAAIGEGVTKLAVGHRVVALVGYAGGYADQVIVNQTLPIIVPDYLDLERTLPLVAQGSTAYVSLTETGIDLRGKRVLIHGASSGVGIFLVQLARCFGARQIIASSGSPDKWGILQELGAHTIIDHRHDDWTEQVMVLTGGRGADVVLDGVGGSVGPKSVECMAYSATFVVFGHLGGTVAMFDFPQSVRMMGQNIRVAYVGMPQDTMQKNPGRLTGVLETLFSFAADGRLRSILSEGFALEDVSAAHRALEQRSRIGKLYLKP
jgi:NADPH2:quinone reductase